MADVKTKNHKEVVYNAANRPWLLWHRPFRVAPRMYYVGNTWVGAYLIDTGAGLILLDTTLFEDVYLVLEAIRELGFDPHDIRHILLSHCHIDHSGGVCAIQALSGAKVWQSREDTEFMTRPANRFGGGFKVMEYTVDCCYDDNVPIALGDVSIRTLLTPGHTPGTTSFFITMPDEAGRPLVVAMHGGVGTNTMNDEYFERFGEDKGLRSRFISDCVRLKETHVDICVPSHPAHGALFQRIGEDPMDYRPLLDPGEWPKFLDERRSFVEALIK